MDIVRQTRNIKNIAIISRRVTCMTLEINKTIIDSNFQDVSYQTNQFDKLYY